MLICAKTADKPALFVRAERKLRNAQVRRPTFFVRRFAPSPANFLPRIMAIDSFRIAISSFHA